MEEKLLQVNDVIVKTGNLGIEERIVIDRVTDKFAFYGDMKFNREVSKYGGVKRLGKGFGRWKSYRIATPTLTNAWLRSEAISNLQEIIHILQSEDSLIQRENNIMREGLESIVHYAYHAPDTLDSISILDKITRDAQALLDKVNGGNK